MLDCFMVFAEFVGLRVLFGIVYVLKLFGFGVLFCGLFVGLVVRDADCLFVVWVWEISLVWVWSCCLRVWLFLLGFAY